MNSSVHYLEIRAPSAVEARELHAGTMLVKWNADHIANKSRVTGFRIFLWDMTCTDTQHNLMCVDTILVQREGRETTTSNVERGKSYRIEIITLSDQVPSEPTPSVFVSISEPGI